MDSYKTTFKGLPVEVFYTIDAGISIWSVEWRSMVELFDAMTDGEIASLYGEMECNLQADLFDAADFARDAAIEEKMHRRAA
jgi:hypothetical protein